MDLCGYAKILLEQYLYAESIESLGDLTELLDNDITVIGTGKSEISETLPGFMSTLAVENPIRRELKNKIDSVWAKELYINEDVRLVYGEVFISGSTTFADTPLQMDMRYTLVFRCDPQNAGNAENAVNWRSFGSEWKLVHIHQSIPNFDQLDGEYYPKTLLMQVDEANRRADIMQRLAAEDSLTGLLNHSAFYTQSEQLLKESGSGYCMAIDLDDFKAINDTYGHYAGDEVLRRMSGIITEAVGENGICGRIGGDEFAVFISFRSPEEDVRKTAERILKKAAECAKNGDFPGVSIGISQMKTGETLKMAFRRADELLYIVKRGGKNGYRFLD